MNRIGFRPGRAGDDPRSRTGPGRGVRSSDGAGNCVACAAWGPVAQPSPGPGDAGGRAHAHPAGGAGRTLARSLAHHLPDGRDHGAAKLCLARPCGARGQWNGRAEPDPGGAPIAFAVRVAIGPAPVFALMRRRACASACSGTPHQHRGPREQSSFAGLSTWIPAPIRVPCECRCTIGTPCQRGWRRERRGGVTVTTRLLVTDAVQARCRSSSSHPKGPLTGRPLAGL